MMSATNAKHLFAMLPCYNEQDDIGPLVEKWVALASQFQSRGYALTVCCIDDKSTDNTNAVIRSLCAKHPGHVQIIEHEVNKGLGGAVFTAFTRFVEYGSEGDLLVLMDGDNTHEPMYALDMLPLMESGAHCVIASRYQDGSSTNGVSPLRLFMSWGARAFYTATLHVDNVRDYTCGYRMYSYSLIEIGLETFGERLVEERTFACMMEVLYKFALMGANFKEVPFDLHYDSKQGESKMRVIKTARASICTALSLRLRFGRLARKVG